MLSENCHVKGVTAKSIETSILVQTILSIDVYSLLLHPVYNNILFLEV